MARQLDSKRPSACACICSAALSILLAISSPASAQTPAAPAPPATSSDAAPPAPTASSGSDYECLPSCRSGFVCVMRQCVSACNPACPSGEVCTADARCVSACTPACGAGQTCTAQGQCITPAPQGPPAQGPAQPQPAPSFDEPPRVTFTPGASTYGDGDLVHEDSASERRRTGRRFHNGFYLRLGIGAGYLLAAATAETDGTDGTSSNPDAGQQGFTVPVELAIGGSPAPGFVIGGGIWSLNVPAGEYTVGRGDHTKTETASAGGLTMIGPFFDLYPAPRAGFHLQAAPGVALLFPGHSDATGDLFGAGFGAMGGLGYEGWVSDNWGLGVLARVQFFTATVTNADGDKYSALALAPSLLMTTTFN